MGCASMPSRSIKGTRIISMRMKCAPRKRTDLQISIRVLMKAPMHLSSVEETAK